MRRTMQAQPVQCIFDGKGLRVVLPYEYYELNYPTYSINIECFFGLEDELLGFKGRALEKGDEDFFLSLTHTITYGDHLAAGNFVRKRLNFHPEKDLSLNLPPLDELWRTDPEVTQANPEKLMYSWNFNDIHGFLTECVFYFLRYAYLRICQITGCPYDVDGVKSLYHSAYYDPYRSNTFTYIDKENKLVFAVFLPRYITNTLFPPQFFLAHPEYFLVVPISELLLLCKERLGLRYLLGIVPNAALEF